MDFPGKIDASERYSDPRCNGERDLEFENPYKAITDISVGSDPKVICWKRFGNKS